MKKGADKEFVVFIAVTIFLMAFVLAAPSFHTFGTYSYLSEDSQAVFSYNFTANVTNAGAETLIFEFVNITPSPGISLGVAANYYWVSLNPSTGIISINSSSDNQTGRFNVSVFVRNTGGEGQSALFYFVVNATNDVPVFSNLATMNVSQDSSFTRVINATDEERQYPLFFNVSFESCSLASWSTKGTNCTLFNISRLENSSAIINFTPVRNDVGVYYVNFTVTDNGNSSTCPYLYCDAGYTANKTKNQQIVFEVYGRAEINTSLCNNSFLNEQQQFNCSIGVITRYRTENISLWSVASLRNYASASIENTSWFFSTVNVTSGEYTSQYNVSIIPGKKEIGNWSIVAHALDYLGNSITETIYLYVNRTGNALPELMPISNVETSVSLPIQINLTVFDNDLLIQDKYSGGGFNETINFTRTIKNSTGAEFAFFNVSIYQITGNITRGRISFTPTIAEAGNFSINITVSDKEGALSLGLFNISIVSNSAPNWSQSVYYFNTTVNATRATSVNFTYNITANGIVSDSDSSTITLTNSSEMRYFKMVDNGYVNFTPYKEDVGYYNVTMTATDELGMSGTSLFSFHVSNVDTPPSIVQLANQTGAFAATEDAVKNVIIDFFDDDFLIRQTAYYNESLNISVGIEGPNPSLFSLGFVVLISNKSRYQATFIPNKSDVGYYNITVNVTDASYANASMLFVLQIDSVNHKPNLTFIQNQTSSILESLWMDINATDIEDGSDLQGNLTYFYNFTTGTNFFNESVFNRTSGILNISFNYSLGGSHRINMSVNDSVGAASSQVFTINVYDYPSLINESVVPNGTFSVAENSTIILNVTPIHAVGDRVSFSWYINNELRNLSSVANGSRFGFVYTPNFSEENCGGYKNLTLYINNTKLSNSTSWQLSVNHTNDPVTFITNLPNFTVSGTSTSINLRTYFSDNDASDPCNNQTVSFRFIRMDENFVALNPGTFTTSISNWTVSSNPTINFSTSSTYTEYYQIIVNDTYNEVKSNNFSVSLTVSTTTVTTSGGGGSMRPVGLKIIMPEPLSVYKGQTISVPITVKNQGTVTLSDIDLYADAYKNLFKIPGVDVLLSKNFISSLDSGQSTTLNLTIRVNTNDTGLYEININGTAKYPYYNDWGKFYLTVRETNMTDVQEVILFTEELIVQNPECLELKEQLTEARKLQEAGKYNEAVGLANQVVTACREAISQRKRTIISERPENQILFWILIFIAASFVLIIIYQIVRRIKLRRQTYSQDLRMQ